MYKFGFIGSGNMGSALAKAVCSSAGSENVIVCDADSGRAEKLASALGCACGDIHRVADESKYIFIAVKPQALESMFSEITGMLSARDDRFILVSMAAGTKIEKIERLSGVRCPVIRIMPNVAASVGAAMTLCAANKLVSNAEYDYFIDVMGASGRLDRVEEEKIDAYSLVTGCGPAWVYLMIEALADGQVDIGVPRDKAYLYTAQMVAGAAELMLKSGKIPAELKDSVCSPGGTTIEGVRALENKSFRAALIEAVRASYDKTVNM